MLFQLIQQKILDNLIKMGGLKFIQISHLSTKPKNCIFVSEEPVDHISPPNNL